MNHVESLERQTMLVISVMLHLERLLSTPYRLIFIPIPPHTDVNNFLAPIFFELSRKLDDDADTMFSVSLWRTGGISLWWSWPDASEPCPSSLSLCWRREREKSTKSTCTSKEWAWTRKRDTESEMKQKSKKRRKGASERRRDWDRTIAHDESGHVGDWTRKRREGKINASNIYSYQCIWMIIGSPFLAFFGKFGRLFRETWHLSICMRGTVLYQVPVHTWKCMYQYSCVFLFVCTCTWLQGLVTIFSLLAWYNSLLNVCTY